MTEVERPASGRMPSLLMLAVVCGVLTACGSNASSTGAANESRAQSAASSLESGAGTPDAVESDGAPTLHAAFAAGQPVDAPAGGIAADSLAPKRVGDLAFPIVQAHVEPEVVLVTDDEIRQAQVALWTVLRIVAEPGGAAAFAALLSQRYRPAPGERVAVLVCGGNTTAVNFSQ